MNQVIQDQPGNPWQRIPVQARQRLIWVLWFITWTGLLAGLFDRTYYEYVVAFSFFHTVLFMFLFKFHIYAFPVQVRIAFLIWVVIGTFVPYMVFLMYITTIGLPSNLFLGYCPLARSMYLLPWNRQEPISMELLKRVVMSPPVKGQFKPQ